MLECQERQSCGHCSVKKITFSSVTSQILQVKFLSTVKKFPAFICSDIMAAQYLKKTILFYTMSQKVHWKPLYQQNKLKLLPTTYPLEVVIQATIIYYRRRGARNRFRNFQFKNEIVLKKSPGESPVIIPGVYFICALMSESLRNPNLV